MDAVAVAALDVTVRPAAEADLAAVLALYAQPDLDDGDVLDEAQATERFRDILALPHHRLFVAQADGHVVGTFLLTVLPLIAHQGRAFGVVESVAVDPAFHGRGIGGRMMAHARALCAEAGCYKMALSSNVKRERAHRFYEERGFSLHGYSFAVAPD